MDYSSSYVKARGLADEIRAEATASKASGLAARKRSNVDIGGIDPSLFGVLSIEDMYSDIGDYTTLAKFEAEETPPVEDLMERPLESVVEDQGLVRPITPLKGLGGGALEGDLEFEDAVAKLQERFPGLKERELYRIIEGESAFDPTVVNEYNMAGLFQISPESAKRLGVTTGQIAAMSPSEQVDLYGDYLDMWDYDKDMSLAVLQAAPAHRSKPDDFVVYKKGTKAWKANAPWRPEGGGDITIGSIKRYYE